MQKLKEDGLGSQRNFGEMRKARGIDIRNERPSSAEFEQAHEEPEASVAAEDLGEAEYDPFPQAPPTVPGTRNSFTGHSCPSNSSKSSRTYSRCC